MDKTARIKLFVFCIFIMAMLLVILVYALAPTITSIDLISTPNTNYTDSNITFSNTTSDVDGDPVTTASNIYINGISPILLNMPFNSNGSEPAKDYSPLNYSGDLGAGSKGIPFFNATGDKDGYGAYEFDDLSAILSGEIPNYYGNNKTFTISTWFKRNANEENGTVLNGYAQNGGGNYLFNLGFNNGQTIRVIHWTIEQGGITQVGPVIPIDEWHFATIVYNRTDFFFYVDAVLYDTDAKVVNGTRELDWFQIGSTNGAGTNGWGNFSGTVDDPMIWNIALGIDEIVSINNSGMLTEWVSAETSLTDQLMWNICPTEAKDEGIDGDCVNSTVMTVLNAPPIISNLILNSTSSLQTNYTNETITANWLCEDIDIETINYNLEWYRFDVNRTDLYQTGTCINSEYVSSQLDYQNLTEGEQWRFIAYLDDGTNSVSSSSDNYTVINSEPLQEIPLIGGYEREPLNESLVAYYRLECDGIDETGVNNGTLINFDNNSISGCTEQGRVGSAMNLDGADDQINATDINELDNTTAFTVSGWANQKELDKQNGIWSKWVSGAKRIDFASWNDGYMYGEITDGTNNAYGRFDYSTVVSANTWFHWVMVYNGDGATNSDRLKIYINGVSQTLGFSAINIPSMTQDMGGEPFVIGRYRPDLSQFWNGTLDEIKVWNISLSEQEVSDMYLNESYQYKTNQDIGVSVEGTEDTDETSEENTQKWWTVIVNWFIDGESLNVLKLPFDTIGLSNDGNESATEDFSGYGNNGTIFGAVRTQSELNSSQILDPSLLLYYKMNANSNKTSAYDSSTYGLNGNVFTNGSGDNVNVTGKIKEGVFFDGDGDYIDTDYNSFAEEVKTYTFWMKPDGSGFIASAGQGSTTDNEGIYFTTTTHGLYAGFNNGADLYNAKTGDPSITGWHHFAVIMDRATNVTTIYQDGVNTTVLAENVIAFRNGNLEIGRRVALNDNYFNGSLDEFAVWNKTLTTIEIDELYRKGLEGKIGSAMNLDGVNNYIVTNDNPILDINGSITVSSWVKTLGTNGHIVTSPWLGSDAYYAMRLLATGKIDWNIYNGASTVTSVSTNALNDGNWHYIVGTYDGSRVKIYVDGNVNQDLPQTGTNNLVHNISIIGARCNTNCATFQTFYNGSIDEVEVYNRTLTPEQIKQNYEKGLEGHPNNILSWTETVKGNLIKAKIWVTDLIKSSIGLFTSEITILNTEPTSPSLLYPDNASLINNLVFNWTNSSDIDNDAITYTIEIDNNIDFSSPEYRNTTIEETSNPTHDYSAVLSEGTYYWRVLATDSNNTNSTWAGEREFIYDITIPIIASTVPLENNGTNVSDTLTLNIEFSDTNFYFGNVSIFTQDLSTFKYENFTDDFNGTLYTFTDVIDTSSWDTGNYVVIAHAEDDHTGGLISNLNKLKKGESQVVFTDKEDLEINAIFVEKSGSGIMGYKLTDSPANLVSSYDLIDNSYYKFTYNFTVLKPETKLILNISGDNIRYFPDSEYYGHFVWDKYYIDFEDVKEEGYTIKVEQIDEDYLVLMIPSTPAVGGQVVSIDPALGGVNIVEESYLFLVDNSVPSITITSPEDNSTTNDNWVNVTFTISDDSTINNCKVDMGLSINNVTNTSIIREIETNGIEVYGLDYSIDYYYKVYCTDEWGQEGVSETRRLNVRQIEGSTGGAGTTPSVSIPLNETNIILEPIKEAVTEPKSKKYTYTMVGFGSLILLTAFTRKKKIPLMLVSLPFFVLAFDWSIDFVKKYGGMIYPISKNLFSMGGDIVSRTYNNFLDPMSRDVYNNIISPYFTYFTTFMNNNFISNPVHLALGIPTMIISIVLLATSILLINYFVISKFRKRFKK